MPRRTPSNSLIIAVSVITIMMLTACSGPSAEAQLAKARQEIKSKNDRAALINLRNLVKQHPKNAQGRLLLGSLLFKLGDPGTAASQLQQANLLKPIPIDAQFQLVQSLIQIGKLDNAAKVLDAMKVSEPAHKAESMAFEGEIALGKKQTKMASKSFAAALTLNPHSTKALVGQAIIALIASKPDLALQEADAAIQVSPNSATAWMVKGDAAFAQHEVQNAATYLERALKYGQPGLSPSQIFLTRGHLAQAELALGQRDKALSNVDAMLSQSPKNPFPNYLRGLIDYENKNYASAAQYVQTALNFDPYNVNALTLLASAEAKQGQDVLAMNHLAGALAQDPQNLFAKRLMASLQLKSGEDERAMQTIVGNGGSHASTNEILSLFSSPDAAVKTLTAMQARHKSNSSSDTIKLALAQALIIGAKQQQALSVLEEIKGNGVTRLNQLRLKAAAYLRAKEPLKAIGVAREIASEDARDVKALTLSALIYVTTNEDAQAKAVLKRAHLLKPSDVTVNAMLATFALKEGRIDEASSDFQAVLKQDPKNLNAMLSLARINAIRGKSTDSLKWLERAKIYHPKSPIPLLALAQYHLAVQQPAPALDDMQQAVSLVPGNPKVLTLLAKTQLVNGEKNTSLRTFQSVAKLDPNNPVYGMNLAAMETLLNHSKAAQTTLESVAEKHPDYYPAFRALAVTQWRNGDKRGAYATAAKIGHGNHGKLQREILIGDLDFLNKKYAAALNNYQLVYAKVPSSALTLRIYKAETTGHLGNPDDALLSWLQTHPRDVSLRNLLAMDYLKKNKLKDSETQFRLVLKLMPNNPAILNNLAWIVSKSNSKQALLYAEKAYKIAPKVPQIADTLGWILIQLKESSQALPLLKQAAQALPNSASIQYHYSVALADNHLRTDALRNLKNTLAKFPSFHGRTEAKALYKKLQNT